MKNLLTPALLLLGASLPGIALAHGTLEIPVSRALGCYKEGAESPKSEACKAAVQLGGSQALYDWNAINQNPNGNHQAFVPDGQLCSGGKSQFKGMDLARNDWPATAIAPDANGNFEFVYHGTAPHATQYFRFYITRDGYNPLQPLKWSDLELFATSKGGQVANQRYRMSLPLPKGKTGRHILYTVWQRSDSAEAFYSCSDVKFSDDGGKPPQPTNWKEVGQVMARQDLAAGSKVTLRLFDGAGRDAAKHTITVDAASGKANQWPLALAQNVNSNSSFARIGVFSNGNVSPVADATANRVYVDKAHGDHTSQIDISAPDTPTPNPGGNEWKEGASYVVGQVVSYRRGSYRCLQAHTAWAGANWNPASSPTLWEPLSK
ncbi:lytic polysaccharide monooxygenase [Parachitinimonas caeni]|uniref:Lytic polysaccharide monooxygenase n=1 Tax=Parachitinimonas caeni TaxID=3031301 RepID=A0ABT7DVL7_9NEIS|nr:lytic polysaccharide monooxygenase [Parachitinimonas caeni]MDK2124113.1 lytic polysaccharide monooxygenase [Parachitinimonas caeni]